MIRGMGGIERNFVTDLPRVLTFHFFLRQTLEKTGAPRDPRWGVPAFLHGGSVLVRTN
jgi:hypothetical protein